MAKTQCHNGNKCLVFAETKTNKTRKEKKKYNQTFTSYKTVTQEHSLGS